MQEIFVPELISALFLLLALLRPRVKKLQPLEGIAFLPLLALLVTLGLFPSYGFRPEAVPLLAFSLVITIFHMPVLAASLQRKPYEVFFDVSPAFTAGAFLFLCASTALALCFAPIRETGDINAEVETLTLLQEPSRGRRGRTREYFLRIYRAPPGEGGEGGEKPLGEPPLLVLSPPPAGSIAVTDLVCRALRDRGFTVLSWSCRGVDAPAVDGKGRRYGVSPAEWARRFQLSLLGRTFAKVNAAGKALEEERRQETLFILSSLREGRMELSLGEAVFLAGYSESGSALAILAGSQDFIRNYPQVKGVILIESPLWSFYEEKEKALKDVPEDAPWYQKAGILFSNWLEGLSPGRIGNVGHTGAPLCPAMALVSGNFLEGDKGRKPYAPLLLFFGGGAARHGPSEADAPAPAIIAAAEGSGPLDYSAIPLEYPLLSAIEGVRGKRRWPAEECLEGTASLIANFAAMALEAFPSRLGSATVSAPKMRPLPGPVDIESWDWNLSSPGYILVP